MDKSHYLSVTVLLSLAMLQPASAARLYKWVDENGVVHYSDKMTADQANKQHEQLNDQGVVTKNVGRQKTEQEREQEKASVEAEVEARKKVALENARKRAKDKIILDTYTTERDLYLMRDSHVADITSMINLTKSNIESLKRKIKETQNYVDVSREGGRDVPESTKKKLIKDKRQLDRYTQYVVDKESERKKIIKKFDHDLQRFRELKGIVDDTQAEEVDTANSAETKAPAADSNPTQAANISVSQD